MGLKRRGSNPLHSSNLKCLTELLICTIMLVNQKVWCTHHNCFVVILDLNEGSPADKILCQFEDGRSQSIPRVYLSTVGPEMRKRIRKAFGDLMGMNGDTFVEEIYKTGKLSDKSYEIICDNVSYNGADSVIEHMGLVYYYHSLTNKTK